jgi:hypothetical protein
MSKRALSEITDRTTLVPGEAPALVSPALARVIDALFVLKADPHDRAARIQLALLTKDGAACCPSCGGGVDLTGFRRVQTTYASREEWCCRGCRARVILDEEQVV